MSFCCSSASPDKIRSNEPSRMSSAAMDAIWGFAFKWSQTNWNSRSCAALMIRLMSFCRLLVEGRF